MSSKNIVGVLLIVFLIVILTACGSDSEKANKQFNLSITTEGEGSVEPEEGIYEYEEGTVVSLSTTTDTTSGWYFSSWGGPDGSEVAENKILMDRDKVIKGIFLQSDYEMNVNITPEGAGTVDKVILPSVQNIGYGETVRLTAEPNSGFVFDHWEEEGELDGSVANPAVMTMAGDKDVTAVFVQSDYSLNITAENGTVAKDPDQAGYRYAEIVSLQASPDEGYIFDHWEGDIIGNANPVEITMDESKEIKATFVKERYDLNVSIGPDDSSGDILLAVKEDLGMEYGQILTLTAVSETGYVFDHWEGDLSGDNNPVDLTMDMNKSVRAVFRKEEYGLNTSVFPVDSGSINKDPDKIVYGHGEVVNITATPVTGYLFDHWEGNLSSEADPADNLQQITMDSDKDLTAIFVRKEYGLTVTASPVEGGTVDKVILPSVQNIGYGETVRLTAEPNSGYVFDHWEGEGELNGSVANPVVVTMAEDKDVTAVFARQISGRIVNTITQSGIEGITINFSDGSSTITDSQGYWTKNGISVAGTITVTPEVPAECYGPIFTPEVQEVSWLSSEKVDFTFVGYTLKEIWEDNDVSPYGIAIDNSGYVYISNYTGGQIKKFDSTGVLIDTWSGYNYPRGIAVDDLGNIYMYAGNDVHKYNGSQWSTLISDITKDGYDVFVHDIAIDDRDGGIYLSSGNGDVGYKYNSEGSFVEEWIDSSAGGIAIDDSGNIYMVDYDAANSGLYKLSNNYYGVVYFKQGLSPYQGSPGAEFCTGVALDSYGNIYMSYAAGKDYNWINRDGQMIHVLANDGNILTKWGIYGSKPGELGKLYGGVAVDESGNIYVADNENSRIQIFAPVE